MLYEQAEREHACCFTGRRSENLKLSERGITSLLKTAISEAINDGFTTIVITSALTTARTASGYAMNGWLTARQG